MKKTWSAITFLDHLNALVKQDLKWKIVPILTEDATEHI